MAEPTYPQLDVLVVSAHPDDAELGMGGTIRALKAEGKSVGVLDLTTGEPTPHGDLETRRRETAEASAILGLDWRHCLNLPNRSLQPTLEARRLLAGVYRRTCAGLLFLHYWDDAHPDHVAGCQLSEAARFWAKLTKSDLPGEPHWPQRVLYFFSVHLRQNPRPNFILDITPHIDVKMQALACYHSQFVRGRASGAGSFLDSLRNRARYWGSLIGTEYGEPFACREELGLRRLEHVL